jgi:hypothetical protein
MSQKYSQTRWHAFRMHHPTQTHDQVETLLETDTHAAVQDSCEELVRFCAHEGCTATHGVLGHMQK